MEYHLEIACIILGVKTQRELPYDLRNRLSRISGMCSYAGGALVSRQIVAMVIEQWQRDSGIIEE